MDRQSCWEWWTIDAILGSLHRWWSTFNQSVLPSNAVKRNPVVRIPCYLLWCFCFDTLAGGIFTKILRNDRLSSTRRKSFLTAHTHTTLQHALLCVYTLVVDPISNQRQELCKFVFVKFFINEFSLWFSNDIFPYWPPAFWYKRTWCLYDPLSIQSGFVCSVSFPSYPL